MNLTNTQIKRLYNHVITHNKVWLLKDKDDFTQEVIIKFLKWDTDENFDFDKYMNKWSLRFINQLHSERLSKKVSPNPNHMLKGGTSVPDFDYVEGEDTDTYQGLYLNEFLGWCHNNLTEKQIQMVELLSQGNTKVQVSEILNCSKQNVGQQIKKIQKRYQEQLV